MRTVHGNAFGGRSNRYAGCRLLDGLTRSSLMLSGALLLTCLPLGAESDTGTRGVAERYLALTLSQRYDELVDVYAPQAVFFDPTGEVFTGSVGDGRIHTAQKIIDVQKGWGLVRSRFDVDVSFVVGEYALYRGTYFAGYANTERDIAIPFITVLRVQEDRIAERTDFGEYIQSFGLGTGFDTTTQQTQQIADRYLQAYLGEDLPTQTELLAVKATFQDPTSRIFGPPAGVEYVGADEILERRRQIYPNLVSFDLDVEEAFVAHHHAVYMGTVRYTLTAGPSFAQAAVFVVEVRDGRVTRHWDFVD